MLFFGLEHEAQYSGQLPLVSRYPADKRNAATVNYADRINNVYLVKTGPVGSGKWCKGWEAK
jgi:hypothetical protein